MVVSSVHGKRIQAKPNDEPDVANSYPYPNGEPSIDWDAATAEPGKNFRAQQVHGYRHHENHAECKLFSGSDCSVPGLGNSP